MKRLIFFNFFIIEKELNCAFKIEGNNGRKNQLFST